MQFLTVLFLAQPVGGAVEAQPLPEGVADSGINVLLDQSHAMSFFWHWSVQDDLRCAGHRVSCSQASLHRVLTPGELANARDQSQHRFPREGEGALLRPMVRIPVPEYDVVVLVGAGSPLPYLPAEVDALTRFLERGGGVVVLGRHTGADSPLANLVAGFGARFLPDPVTAPQPGEVPGLDTEARALHAAEVGDDWSVLAGGDASAALVAQRSYGAGRILLVADDRLAAAKDDQGRDAPNRALLSWLVEQAAGAQPRRVGDERRAPWEHGGIGGAFYPEHALDMGGLTVYYADNQLEHIRAAAEDGFEDVRDILARLLPTPPNPGDDMYIVLAGGDGGGWAENVFVPKVAGTIATDLNAVKSILAHELTHTLNGPEAFDGTPGCVPPAWWSEAHAGFFQRKVMRELGDCHGFYSRRGVMSWDPLLREVDLANLGEGEMGKAWEKVWFLWSLLDDRYGEQWYPNWLGHLHRKYAADPTHHLTMDEYIISVSESVGEDVSPLFELFGTSVGERAPLPPIAPRP